MTRCLPPVSASGHVRQNSSRRLPEVMVPLNPFDGPMAEAKARVFAAVMAPERHPAVYGVGIANDDDDRPVVNVMVVGDDSVAAEVRQLCLPDRVLITFLEGTPTFRKTARVTRLHPGTIS